MCLCNLNYLAVSVWEMLGKWWQKPWEENVQETQDILGTLKQHCQISFSPGPFTNILCLAVSLIHDLYLLIHIKWLIMVLKWLINNTEQCFQMGWYFC
jgi:hypothetical protein